MNKNLNAKSLPVLTAGLGLLALLLRLGLYLLGTDEKGLLIPMHPLDLLTWAVTAVAVLLSLLSVRKLDGSARYYDNFSASTPAAIGTFALAGGIAVSVISSWAVWPRLDLIRNLCGLLAVPSIIWVGLCRWQGKRPSFTFHGVTCLYLTLYAVSHYQTWSSRPQLQDYFFSMAGAVLLTLFAYYQTAFDVGMGKRRMQLVTGLLAAFFCMAAAAAGEDLLLYAGGAVWTLTNLCSLTPVKRRRPNPITEPAKEDRHESA